VTDSKLQGWNNPEGDRFFARQRKIADATSVKNSKQAQRTAKFFFKMMQDVGKELHASTGVFNISRPHTEQPAILDMCMAPGGILSIAMQRIPNASVTAYSLPVEAGGHEVFLPKEKKVNVKMLDVTMLAADLGMNKIPHDHPDKSNFLPKEFDAARAFDIVLCDGQVLRTHERAAYREQCEARRLAVSQLILGLEHLRPSGKMIILMHKLEAPAVVEISHQFHQFSSIRLFKPTKAHAKRSSFYLVASNIQVEHPQAIAAVEKWKRTWEIATFGNNEENIKHLHRDSSWAEKVLEDFGPVLVDMGKTNVWDVQAKALAEAQFIAGKAKQPQSSGQWGRKY
jgi:23S rRNA U2552 (ribose-2'-O)-methylase RlmE/FtsJ